MNCKDYKQHKCDCETGTTCYFHSYHGNCTSCDGITCNTVYVDKKEYLCCECEDNKTPIARLKIMVLNDFTNRCGYFKDYACDADIHLNNGYNCTHPKQIEKYEVKGKEIGCCYGWSCPLGYEPDEEDCEMFGVEYEEGEFVVIAYDEDGSIVEQEH